MKRMNRWISLGLILCMMTFTAAGWAEDEKTEEEQVIATETPKLTEEPTSTTEEPAPKPAEEPAPEPEKKSAPETAKGESEPPKEESKETSGGENQEKSGQNTEQAQETKSGTPGEEENGNGNSGSSGEGEGAGSGNSGTGNETGSGDSSKDNKTDSEGSSTENDTGSGNTEGGEETGSEGSSANEGSGSEDASSEGDSTGEGNGDTEGGDDSDDGPEEVSGEETEKTEEENTESELQEGPTEGLQEGLNLTQEEEALFDIRKMEDGWVLFEYKGQQPGVTVPDGVEIIGEGAFKGNATVETVSLPGTVTEIQNEAFAKCTALKKVTIRNENGEEDILMHRYVDQNVAERFNLKVAENAFEEADFIWIEEEPEEKWDPFDGVDFSGGGSGSSGSGSTKKKTTTTTPRRHARATSTMTHDYDQVQLVGATEETMNTLTLGGEELELSLEGGVFTLALYDPEHPEASREEHEAMGDTLILTTEGIGSWKINGAVLRKLNKSGVDTLMLQNGKQSVSVPTDGFLAGWVYDELKSRGTAGRRFEYEMRVDENGTHWQVTVEGKTYELGEDPLAPMYLTGVIIGKGE